MGIRGQKPKPTHLKVLEGNPGKRPLNNNEPKPKTVRPPCPRWLSKEAKKEWRRVVPELERLGLLTIVDRAALAGYCQSWAQWREANEQLEKYGNTFETPNGYVQQRPEVGIANKALQNIRAFCAEFGLTPSARSRMTLPEQDDSGDGMEELLGNN